MPGEWVEMKRLVVRIEKRFKTIRDLSTLPLADSCSVTLAQRECNAHGGMGMAAVDAVLMGESLRELGHGPLGGDVLLKSFTDPTIDYKTEIAHKGKDGLGERPR